MKLNPVALVMEGRTAVEAPAAAANGTMDTGMDIDMDLDLGQLPEPDPIELVSEVCTVGSKTKAVLILHHTGARFYSDSSVCDRGANRGWSSQPQ